VVQEGLHQGLEVLDDSPTAGLGDLVEDPEVVLVVLLVDRPAHGVTLARQLYSDDTPVLVFPQPFDQSPLHEPLDRPAQRAVVQSEP